MGQLYGILINGKQKVILDIKKAKKAVDSLEHTNYVFCLDDKIEIKKIE